MIDAHLLTLTGAAFKLEPDRTPHKDPHDLRELQVTRAALIIDRTR